MGRTRTLWFALSLLFFMALAAVAASDKEEMTLTVQISAAEHEVAEGYFSLGDTGTIMAKPGSDLFRFLARHRGHSVKITLAENAGRQLSSLGKGQSDR